jgi:hypothetical protein
MPRDDKPDLSYEKMLEILSEKEAQSPVKFDYPEEQSPSETKEETPTPQNTVEPKPQVEEILQSQRFATNPDDAINPIDLPQRPSLGKSTDAMRAQPTDIGWKNLPVGVLPSKGLYYPEGTKIAIRPADVKEIRHFSTIDEDDQLDIEEKLSYITDRCMRMDFPGEGIVSYKDLKVEDRFFVILAIRDLTFVKGENMIILTPKVKCDSKLECPIKNGFELRTGVLSSYDLDGKISNFYSSDERCFVFEVKKINKTIRMWIPSIGVTEKISQFTRYCKAKSIQIDPSFIDIAPFIFEDWRNITNESLLNSMMISDYNWTKEEFSILFELSSKIKIGTRPEARVSCPTCGASEVTAPIGFPNGIRSLFVISDIFREFF